MARERKFLTIDLFKETKEILLELGYDRYTMGVLAERLSVSRAAIYKYYTNKDDLIVDFMLDEMGKLLRSFRRINELQTFEARLMRILTIIFDSKDLHHILTYASQIHVKDNDNLTEKLQLLRQQHLEMYEPLMDLMELGKEQKLIHQDLPSSVMISFVFQVIMMPNHMEVEKEVFIDSVRKLVLNGLYTHH